MTRDATGVGSMRKFPKIDLHCHIDGALRVATLRDLAGKKGVKLPTEDLDELAKYVQVSPSCRSLGDFLKTFEFFYPFLMGPEPMERAMYELCEDMARDGVVYFEGRFAPVLQAKEHDSEGPVALMDEVTRAVVRGALAGRRDFGIECGVILCCYRPESPESSLATVKLAEKYRGVVVGVDLAGDESKFPLAIHSEAFRAARGMRHNITVHAGEAGGADSVRDALDLGHARRVGHGVRLQDDEGLMDRIRGEGVCIECCLTSNLQTCSVPTIAEHPFPMFRRRGIAATINTDDPGVSAITLSHEYALARSAFELTDEELLDVTMTACEHSFAEASTKARVRDRCRFRYETRRELEELPARANGVPDIVSTAS